ncbi:MAG: hypothetical protein HY431_03150 [Candidatus Levybacteria bacterium]|nr:hypothetical protein [Candidatus Levybacteria bacterium]
MSKFAERLKQSVDSRLPHFSTSLPYIVATILIMLVPLTVILSQQETKIRSQAFSFPVRITVTNSEDGTAIADASVSIDYQPGQDCPTDTNGKCVVYITNHEPGQVHAVYAYKEDEFVLGKKEFTINPAAEATTVSIALAPVKTKESLSTSPSPGSKSYESYEINVTVRDDQSGRLISGAYISLDGGSLNESGVDCTTHVEGVCAFTVYTRRNYKLHVEKEGYADRDTTISVQSSQTNINIDMVQEDSAKSPADGTKDPNTGGPKDGDTPDDGSNPPGPDDLKCLGGICETPTPTPPYCITPTPTEEEPEEDTDTPSPSNQSILDLIRQRINEAFSRFGDLFNTNPNNSPAQ